MPFPVPDLKVQPTSGLTFPWAEVVQPDGSSSDSSFGSDPSSAMVMLIDFQTLETAIPELLGFAQKVPYAGILEPPNTGSTGSRGRLTRQLPWQHPRFRERWCTKITSCKGLQFTDKRIIYTSPLAGCTLIQLTLQFTRPDYRILPDTALPIIPGSNGGGWGGSLQEWLRYTSRLALPNTEVYTRRAMGWCYSEGTGTPVILPGIGPLTLPNGVPVHQNAPIGHPVPGSIATKIVITKYHMTWYRVPENCLFDTFGFPSWLSLANARLSPDGALPNAPQWLPGCVNNDTLFGQPEGTFLFAGINLRPVPLPFPPELMGLPVGEQFINEWDVMFQFQHFIGAPGYNRTQTPPFSFNGWTNTGGWNTTSWGGDGRWYAIKSMIDGQRPLVEAPLQYLFTPLP